MVLQETKSIPLFSPPYFSISTAVPSAPGISPTCNLSTVHFYILSLSPCSYEWFLLHLTSPPASFLLLISPSPWCGWGCPYTDPIANAKTSRLAINEKKWSFFKKNLFLYNNVRFVQIQQNFLFIHFSFLQGQNKMREKKRLTFTALQGQLYPNLIRKT